MRLQEAPVSGIVAEIKRFQKAQAKANRNREFSLADDIGNYILKPLFAEMARRQEENGGEPDYRKWEV